jgi:hypothetical protein
MGDEKLRLVLLLPPGNYPKKHSVECVVEFENRTVKTMEMDA